MVFPGLQDTELIHFEKVRDGDGVIAPASAGRDRPVRLRSGQDFLSEQAVRSPRESILIFSNDAEKAVLFIDNSSSEINSLAERQKIP